MGGIFKAITGGETKQPEVVKTDPVADQAAIDAAAQQKANAEIAAKKKNARTSSLLASGGNVSTSDAQTSSVLATGKTQLGA
ncbi:MAG TPA: hypothetical protein VN023_09505 [Methylovorus sp.]|nr:hypothetical protein [Methylovorus sp.]